MVRPEYVVLVWPLVPAGGEVFEDPSVVGPFETAQDAQAWLDRAGHHYHRCKVDRMLSGVLHQVP